MVDALNRIEPMHSRPFSWISIVVLSAGCAGCSGDITRPTISHETKYLLSKPIDCRQAEAEIALLERIRPNGAKQAMTAVGSITPPGLVGGMIGNDFDDRKRVVSGEHATEIDRRIAQMRAHCNLPAQKMEAR